MSTLRIFVSHSHQDSGFCQALTDALRQAGADVWLDEDNLGSGQLIDNIQKEQSIWKWENIAKHY